MSHRLHRFHRWAGAVLVLSAVAVMGSTLHLHLTTNAPGIKQPTEAVRTTNRPDIYDVKHPPTPYRPPSTNAPQVTLGWNRSVGTNIAGYNIYYGVASGTYTNVTPVGNVTNATITLPARGVTYYFAATAVNTLNLESVYSNEINWTAPTNSLSAVRAPEPMRQ